MLLHSLADPSQDLLRDQARYELQGEIDVERFRSAWETIVDRHPALRTAFVWEELKQPLQVVRSKVDLPFQVFDLRELSGTEQQQHLDDYLSHDRQERFVFSSAPLLRLALFRTSNDRGNFVFTSHHLILDHWCISIIHDEFAHLYKGGAVEDLPHSMPLRNYIAWLQQQDVGAAKEFWSNRLRDAKQESSLFSRQFDTTGTKPSHSFETFQLDSTQTSALRQYARSHSLTLGAILQSAWALVLAEFRGRLDVIFGSTVAGRPPEVLGVQSMVGSFINNLPMRVSGGIDETVESFLRRNQVDMQKSRKFDYVSPAQIHQWSGLPHQQSLFDSLVVQLASVSKVQAADLQMIPVNSPLRTAVPVTVTFAEDESSISVGLGRYGNRFDRLPTIEIMNRLRRILTGMVGASDQLLRDFLDLGSAIPAECSVPLSRADSSESRRQKPSVEDSSLSKNADGTFDRELEALYQQLGAEWREIFGVTETDTSFFDLGGTSLQAALFHHRVQAITQKSIPLVQLFQEPTLRGMIEVLRDGDWSVCQETIAAIQPHGSQTPLFCIATPEVNAIGYVALSRHLGVDQPLYVVQSVGEDQRRPTSEELANFVSPYIDAIREVQPRGPYRLVGMCSGAHLAFDIATELTERGQSIEFLGILDTWSWNTLRPPTPMLKLRRRMGYYLKRFNKWSKLNQKARMSELKRIASRKLSRVHRQDLTPSEDQEMPGDDAYQDDGYFRNAAVSSESDEGSCQYSGRVTVFSAPKTAFLSNQRCSAWVGAVCLRSRHADVGLQ